MGSQAPFCLALILCDAIQVDQSTGKATILGTFSSLAAKSYPSVHPQLSIFLELTDGRGETDLVLKLCRVTADSIDGEEVLRFEGAVNFKDPRAVQRLTFGIANLVFPLAGEYRFILETKAGMHIAERRIVAVQKS